MTYMAYRTQVGPMLAPWTLQSGVLVSIAAADPMHKEIYLVSKI